MSAKMIWTSTLKKTFISCLLLVTGLALLPCCRTPEIFRQLKSADGIYEKGMAGLFRSGQPESLVYKSTLTYKDKDFSSLTYVNEVNDSTYKIVLLSNFGNTLLEAQISPQSFNVSSVNSYLNRRPILKLLESDWRLMLGDHLMSSSPALYGTNDNEKIFDFSKGRTHHLYHYKLNTRSVEMIESYSGNKRKVFIEVSSAKDQQPEIFSIEHSSYHLKITMSLLKKVNNETAE